MRKYTKDHEWVDIAGDIATVGITDHAVEQLGDLVFVDLPEIGAELGTGDAAAVVESVKAASDVYCPLAGEVLEVNEAIRDDPAAVNADPQGSAWFFRLRITSPDEIDALLDEAAYRALVG